MHRFHIAAALLCLVGHAACSNSKNADDTGNQTPTVSSSEPSSMAAGESRQSVGDNADNSANAQNFGSSGYGVNFLAHKQSPLRSGGDPNRGGRNNGPGHRPDCVHVSGMGGASIDPNGATVEFSMNFDGCQAGDPNGTTMNGNCTFTLTHDPNDPHGPASIGFGVDANRHFPDGSEMHIHGLPHDGGRPAITVDTNGTIATNGNSVVTRTITASEHRERSLNGNVILDMNITYTAVTVVDSYTDGALVSRVINGQTTVQHNRLKMTAVHTFTNVTEVFGSCDCYPIAGTVEQRTTLDSDPNRVVLDRTFTYTSTCGAVDVDTTVSTDPNILTGQASLTLQACDN